MKNKSGKHIIIQSDIDFAKKLYCRVYGVKDDNDDTNVIGILNGLNALEDKQKYVLEQRYRYGRTFANINK